MLIKKSIVTRRKLEKTRFLGKNPGKKSWKSRDIPLKKYPEIQVDQKIQLLNIPIFLKILSQDLC